MIYTVTFNPALDYVMLLDKFESGGVNRSKEEFLNPERFLWLPGAFCSWMSYPSFRKTA